MSLDSRDYSSRMLKYSNSAHLMTQIAQTRISLDNNQDEFEFF